MAYDHVSDHLKLTWFSEIPRCFSDCFYSRALDRGCIYSDFSCICLAIAEFAPGPDAEACIKACPVKPDQRWAPSRILEFCDLVGERIQLPEYLHQVPRMHRRDHDVDDIDSIYSESLATYDSSDFTTTPEDLYPTYPTDVYTDPYTDPYDISTSTDTSYYPTPTDGFGLPIVTDYPGTTDVYTQPAATPATVTTSQTSSPTSENSNATTTENAATTSGPVSSGLSTGAKAGIAVAAGVTSIILCLFIFWYIRKRKRNRGATTVLPVADNNHDIPEHDGNEKAGAVGSISAFPDNPVGADGKTIHESGGRSIVPSRSLNFETPGPAVYELSGNSAMNHSTPVVNSRFIRSDSMDKQVDPFVSQRISHNVDMSRSSMSVIETKERGSLNASLGELSGTSQGPQQDHGAPFQRSSTPLASADVPLSQLEAEMTLIAEEKERLQQLHSLAKREAELKRQIMARSSGR